MISQQKQRKTSDATYSKCNGKSSDLVLVTFVVVTLGAVVVTLPSLLAAVGVAVVLVLVVVALVVLAMVAMVTLVRGENFELYEKTNLSKRPLGVILGKRIKKK